MDINKIKSRLKGKIIEPDDPEYDNVRTVFPGDIDRKPAVIFQVANENDIVGAIRFAKDAGLPLAVRSGGHSPAGYGVCDNGVVIDLRMMKNLDVDPTVKTAWMEPGLTAAEATKALDPHNLVLGFGDTGSVGIGGISLGGGIGFLVRKFGLAIDNLLAVRMVTADGQVITVDDKNHPDLFWAIRGGGGNFGVAAKFHFRLHDLGDVIGGLLLLPATAESITGFIDLATQAPDELSAIANIMPAPPMPMVPPEAVGKTSIMALMMYAGDPGDGEKSIAPFKKLGPPLADMIRPMRYKDIYFPDDDSYHPTAVAKNFYMKSVDAKLAELIIARLAASDAPMRAVQLRALGGASARIPADATAYAHRKSAIMVNVAAFYKGPDDKKNKKTWVEDLARDLYQGDDAAYVGFMGPGEENRLRNVYPEKTLQRLMRIKRQYDPDNVFRSNFNISPGKK